MRVLHLHSGNLYGGVETALVALAAERRERPEMDPHFGLCFGGRLERELEAEGVETHRLGEVRLRAPRQVWRARRRLDALLGAGRFDVAVCHMYWPHVVFGPTVRRHAIPLVFWMHDATDGRHWLERWANATPADLVICNSRFTAGCAARLFAGTPREVLYCPVRPPTCAPSPARRSALRKELATPEEGHKVIIQVGRMEAWKGHLLHLEALARLAPSPGWTCWFAGGAQRRGEQDYFRRLRATAERLGIGSRVRFLGQRRDVPELLNAADIFCQPNTAPEPFGVVFIEALYAGLPVVATALGGAKEIIDDSCGVLTPPDDAAALAAALRRMIEAPGLAGEAESRKARAAQLCGPAAQLRKLHELLVRSLAGRRAA